MIGRRTFLAMLIGVPAAGATAARARMAPAGRPLVLFSAMRVAGYRFHDGPRIEGRLREGERVILVREPGNPHDPRAVAVWHPSGMKLGYIPKRFNFAPAELLDEGVALEVELAAVATPPAPPWERLRIRIVVPETSVPMMFKSPCPSPRPSPRISGAGLPG